MKVVFDTNIYISAFLFPGTYPEFVIYRAMQGSFELYVSDFIMKEFKRVLKEKFKLTPAQSERYIKFIKSFTISIKTKNKINIIKESRGDNRILELAVDARADYLVTGDRKHLLSLKKHKGIDIISPKEFSNFL